MCGRFFYDDDDADEALAAYLDEARVRAARMGVRISVAGEIRPNDVAAVIATSALRRAVGAYPMRWGFQHPTRGMLVFNTRCETAAQKALFCTSVIDRRCLIPASGYYEWAKENGRKVKYAFRAEGEKPLYLAGVYLRSSKTSLPMCTILTRDATQKIKGIHARMPLMIPQERMEEWLSPKTEYEDMLQYAVENLRFETA